MTKATRARLGSSFASLMRETGDYAAVTATAMKHVLARQIGQEMKAQGVTRIALAKRMAISRNELDGLFDPNTEDVTLSMLVRAAEALGTRDQAGAGVSTQMTDHAAIHLPQELSAALAMEAAHSGVSIDALAEEAIARHLEALKTLAHFANLKANADWGLLDRVLSRQGDDPPVHDSR